MAIAQPALPTLDDGRSLSRAFVAALRQNRRAVRALAEGVAEADRYAFACRFTAAVIAVYWRAIQRDRASALSLRELPAATPQFDLDHRARDRATALGRAAALLDPLEAGYQLGEVYTTALPADLRARHGIYYTPP